MKYLITGANGFLGSEIVRRLQSNPDVELHLAVRGTPIIHGGCKHIYTGLCLEHIEHWDESLFNVDVVIHAAARTHVMKDAENELHNFKLVNTLGTLKLAKRAASAGVKRFVFISTIKVNGEQTPLGHPFTPDDIPNPADGYAISKYEAEKGLLALSKESKMEIVIIRPVMVYGPSPKGNFLSLINFVRKEIPLPLGCVKNLRSIVSVENLVDFILISSHHKAAANQIFLISDGRDLSTPQLISKIAFAMGVKCRIIKIPLWLVNLLLISIGKGAYSSRLFNSLQVDISKSLLFLDWTPPANIDQSLARAFAEFDI